MSTKKMVPIIVDCAPDTIVAYFAPFPLPAPSSFATLTLHNNSRNKISYFQKQKKKRLNRIMWSTTKIDQFSNILFPVSLALFIYWSCELQFKEIGFDFSEFLTMEKHRKHENQEIQGNNTYPVAAKKARGIIISHALMLMLYNM